MSRGDLEELKSLTKQRARVGKAGVEARQAAVLADAEEQLSAIYKPEGEAWRDLAEEADRMIATLDAQLADRCRQMGVEEAFRPRLVCSWIGRGENASRERRAELRKAAERRIQAEGRAAKLAIDEAALAVLTELTSAALTTDEARQFLQRIPTLAELMPNLDVRELGSGA